MYEIGELEAGVFYTLRITHHHGVNLSAHGISVKQIIGSNDATLSDLKIDGATIEGFDPQKKEYTVSLKPYVWISDMQATANDDNATIIMPEDLSPVEGSKSVTYTIKVISEAEFVEEYKIKVVAPTLVDDGISLPMNIVYANNGVTPNATKVNSIGNNDYVDYYIYSAYDDNFILTLNIANGYVDGTASFLNVSTFGVADDAWELKDKYTRKIDITRDEMGVNTWLTAHAQDYDFVLSLKEDEPTILRIYGITTKGTAADIFSMTFKLLNASVGIDATLSDLQVNSATVAGFDPDIFSYDVVLPVGTTTASISATAKDASAELKGGGTLNIEDLKTTDTITVTSESGFAIDYKINLHTPVEINYALTDSFQVFMASNMFAKKGVTVTDSKINRFYDNTYVEYCIYSATDKDVHMVANMSNGNPDTITCKLNVSTYTYGSDWMLDEANTLDVPNSGEGMWGVEYASELDYNISLKAGEPLIVRLFSITDGWLGAGDIFSLRLVEGKSGTTAVKTVETKSLNVWAKEGSINVRNDESFIGGTIQIYDISGKLITSESLTSTRNVYNLDRSGLFFVRVVDKNKLAQTTKCIVR